MDKPRVVIADTDENYIQSIELKFIEDFFDKVQLEIITDQEYFERLFMTPQSADILIVSEDLYEISLQKHNIKNIFVMTEQHEEDQTEELNITKIFKYSSIKGIFNEILGQSAKDLKLAEEARTEPQIVVVTSAAGGVGKTTVAMGMCACLSQNYKKVLYINASNLQFFQYMMKDSTPISDMEVYAQLNTLEQCS
jgi:signal recognition particle GTPase